MTEKFVHRIPIIGWLVTVAPTDVGLRTVLVQPLTTDEELELDEKETIVGLLPAPPGYAKVDTESGELGETYPGDDTNWEHVALQLAEATAAREARRTVATDTVRLKGLRPAT